MIKAILFDCFGVLVGRGFEETYRIAGGDPLKDRQFIDDVLGQANMGLITDEKFHNEMMGQLGISMPEWRQAVVEAEQPNDELLDYIEQLRGSYKTAVLSNANRGVVERRIGAQRVEACFDAVIVSADVGMVKPDPDIYRHVAQKLGVETTECIFVDDKEVFLDGAQTLGMQTILYQDFEQAKTELELILADTKD